ncbi:hypothetical protein B0H16DRAFT_1467406 [Mycena metata]|uniref:Uncharacterized protein n=1 Tax=Mycena metata TaxID=1033252 RepID=A0AAD7I4C7_9AGAR|nr:hypothetical protein B0H16DRAFT_1467406 [Mycena metata]
MFCLSTSSLATNKDFATLAVGHRPHRTSAGSFGVQSPGRRSISAQLSLDHVLTTAYITDSPLNFWFYTLAQCPGPRLNFAGFITDFSSVCNVFPPTHTVMDHPRREPSPTSKPNEGTAQSNTTKFKSVHHARRLRVAHRAASARYRDKNRERLLVEDRLRAARRRAEHRDDPDARARAREASARYRSRNREQLALKQREVRKRAHIKKHGAQAYIYSKYSDKPAPEPVICEIREDDEDDTVEGGAADAPEVDKYQLSSSSICHWEDPFLNWLLD